MGKLQKDCRESGTEMQVDARLKTCLIPAKVLEDEFATLFAIKNFDSFLEKRAGSLLTKIREIVGRSLIETPEENRDEEDRDD